MGLSPCCSSLLICLTLDEFEFKSGSGDSIAPCQSRTSQGHQLFFVCFNKLTDIRGILPPFLELLFFYLIDTFPRLYYLIAQNCSNNFKSGWVLLRLPGLGTSVPYCYLSQVWSSNNLQSVGSSHSALLPMQKVSSCSLATTF